MGEGEFVTVKHPPGGTVDLDTLRAFERGLDPLQPERSAIPARVLGYGEISTVFAIERESMRGLAFKRLSIFETQAELVEYISVYEGYERLLEEEIGIGLPPNGYAAFPDDSGRPIFYIIQEQEPAESLGSTLIHTLDAAPLLALFGRLLHELGKVWAFNARQDEVRVGFDGQVSNWAIRPAEGDAPPALRYLDTSTPLFRVKGREQLNPEMFLRSAPSFLRWVLRLFFMDDVVNRYYDLRRVVIDVIANFYKEDRPELIPALVDAANAFFAADYPEGGPAPITTDEVRAYYKEDAFIWSLYLGMRRLDRWLTARLLRRRYPYILPGRIKR
ncbi:MAG: DUF6206 family protein [Anaerolineae bacterium]